jgi:PAS domain-containing protein
LSPEQKLSVTADFLNNISTGMVLRDTHGIITDCNHAAEEILKVPREQLVGTTAVELEAGAVMLDGTHVDSDGSWVQRALDSGGLEAIVVGFEVPGRLRRWLSIRAWPAIVNG